MYAPPLANPVLCAGHTSERILAAFKLYDVQQAWAIALLDVQAYLAAVFKVR